MLKFLSSGKEPSLTNTNSSLGTMASTLDPRPKARIASLGACENKLPAAQIGLLADDVIVGVNRQRIANLAELRKMLENRDGVAALNIRRGNTNLYVLIR